MYNSNGVIIVSTESMDIISRSIEPATRSFLDTINAMQGPPVYKMPVEQARNALAEIQSSGIQKTPADIKDMAIVGGPNGKVNIRIVRPKDVSEKLPVVMYFHGGGWVLGDKNTHDRLVRELSNKSKAAIVFVDYTRSPEAKFPVALEEDYHAMEYVMENAGDLNLDPSRLAVAGDSVGGNMATVVALMAKQRKGPKIGLQVMFYPVTDANFDTGSYRQFSTGYWLARDGMKWFWDNYLPDKNKRKDLMASPLMASLNDLKGLPPALVITGENDVLRDEGESYAHKLMEAGIYTTSVRFLGTIHDFVMLDALAGTPATRGAIDLASYMLRHSFT